jgi:hypothetical protein
MNKKMIIRKVLLFIYNVYQLLGLTANWIIKAVDDAGIYILVILLTIYAGVMLGLIIYVSGL